jgi:hypothetical protein
MSRGAASNLSGTREQDQEPKISLKLDKDEYYENEAITGQVRLKLAKDLGNVEIRLLLKYEENYVLFNEDGDQAL